MLKSPKLYSYVASGVERKDEIDEANQVNITELRDPQNDAERVQKPEWLVMLGKAFVCSTSCSLLFYNPRFYFIFLLRVLVL